MAHLLFDAVSDGISSVENSSVLSTHSLLDSAQVFTPTISGTENSAEDDDVFQCGKCKKQFTSFTLFISHKKEGCSTSTNTNFIIQAPQSSSLPVSQNAVLVRKIQVPPSPVCTQNVVLTETDLLSLAAAGLDQNIIPSESSNIHIHRNNAIATAGLCTDTVQTAVGVQQVLPQILMGPSGNSVSKDLETALTPLVNNNNKVVAQLFLMRQPNNNSDISGVLLNIADAVPVNDIDGTKVAAPVDVPKTVPIQVDDINKQVPTGDVIPEEEDMSTVNVIAEFYSTMVKTKKKSSDNEKENVSKKEHKLNCAYCSKSFTKNFDLQQHIRSHTGEKPFQCIVCGRAFAQKSNVKKHMQTHKVWPDGLSHTLPSSHSNGNKELKQNGQDLSSDVPDSIDQMEAKEDSYVCPYCPYVGRTYYRLKSHMKQHETKKMYKCIIGTCGLMFSDLDPFLEHSKVHENEMTYQCHECNKTLPTLFELGAHQYTHSLYPNQRSKASRGFFRCTLCLNKYSTLAALNHHLATSPHVYNCVHCNKTFPCERYLRRHLRIHSSVDPFVCVVCNKGFKTEHYLKMHMVIHSHLKPFECTLCSASFNRKDKLKRHLLIHEPVKRYKCPFRTHAGCVKEFNRPDKLKAHVLTHSCVKSYACNTCGRNFTRLINLREHTKIQHKSLSNIKDSEDDNVDEDSSNFNADSESEVHAESSRQLTRPRTRRNFALLHQGRKYFSWKPKTLKRTTAVTNLQPTDDIPTAHIEIISTGHDMSMTEISLATCFSDSDISERLSQVIEGANKVSFCEDVLNTDGIDQTKSIVYENTCS